LKEKEKEIQELEQKYSEWTVRQLRKELRKLKLPIKGKKEDIIPLLAKETVKNNYLLKQKQQQQAPKQKKQQPQQQAPKQQKQTQQQQKQPQKQQKPQKQSQPATTKKTQNIPFEERINQYRVVELRRELSKRKLPTKGKKGRPH